MARYSRVGDVEAGMFDKGLVPDHSLAFAEKTVRLGFVRKVFGLLTVQLAITAAVTALFMASQPIKTYMATNPWVFMTSFGVSLGLIVFLGCSENARRTHPLNLICLFAFTLCEAILVATISATYSTDVVLLAVGITAAVTLGLTSYAMQTKRDFTAAGGILFSLLFALVMAGILSMFVHTRVMNIVIAGVGAAIFSAYIVFDVQLIMGGGHAELSPDEYVFAALNIYLDVINLFLQLLQLIAQSDR